MRATDPFSRRYQDLLDATYDCVDRIVLNGYWSFFNPAAAFAPGGVSTMERTTTWTTPT